MISPGMTALVLVSVLGGQAFGFALMFWGFHERFPLRRRKR